MVLADQHILKTDIAKSFGKAAKTYDSAAHFQRWVGDALLSKLHEQSVRMPHKGIVLDLGCGTGYFADPLIELGSQADYLGLDLSEGMLSFARNSHASSHEGNRSSSSGWLAADAEYLPIKDGSVDLVFSSLAIQWCGDLKQLFSEVHRVLKPGGHFAFSTLLEGSLFELKSAWAKVDGVDAHVNEFGVLDDYRRAAEASRFEFRDFASQEKVLEYLKVQDLTRELKNLGAHNIRAERPKHLTGKARLKAFIDAYEIFRNQDGKLPVSYQVLFGVIRKI